LDGLKKNKRYLNLKEEAQDRTLWRTRYGRGYGLKQRGSVTSMPPTHLYGVIPITGTTLSFYLIS